YELAGLGEQFSIGRIHDHSTPGGNNMTAQIFYFGRRFGFELPESRLSIPLEDFGNCATCALLDHVIGIDKFPTEARGEHTSNGCFARSHEACKNDVLRQAHDPGGGSSGKIWANCSTGHP